MKPKAVKIAVGLLVEDLNVYPRSQVDSTHVAHIADALEAGIEMPAIIADAKSKRIVDGFHRCRAYRRVYGDDHAVAVALVDYPTEAELFADAVRLNSAHGNNITTADRVRCILIADRLGIEDDALCVALNITVERLEGLRIGRIGKRRASATDPDGGQVALKFPIRHMAGKQLTAAQVKTIPDLGGNQQAFYANQLIRLIESGLLDKENERLVDRLRALYALLPSVI